MKSFSIMDGADFNPADGDRYKSLMQFFQKPATIKKMKEDAMLKSYYLQLVVYSTENVK